MPFRLSLNPASLEPVTILFFHLSVFPNLLSTLYGKMKLSRAILLPCTIVAAATIRPRQHDHGATSSGSANTPYSSATLSWPEKYMLFMIETARESWVSWTKASSQPARLSSTTHVAPKLRNDTIRKVFKYGPYTIGPQV